MYTFYQPNPAGATTIDCTVRALTKALDLPWDDAYLLLVSAGYDLKLMPTSASLWGYVLHQKGWKRHVVPDTCPYCYRFRDFVRDHPEGRYVLASGDHVAAVVDGVLFDSWNSEDEILQMYWSRRNES